MIFFEVAEKLDELVLRDFDVEEESCRAIPERCEFGAIFLGEIASLGTDLEEVSPD